MKILNIGLRKIKKVVWIIYYNICIFLNIPSVKGKLPISIELFNKTKYKQRSRYIIIVLYFIMFIVGVYTIHYTGYTTSNRKKSNNKNFLLYWIFLMATLFHYVFAFFVKKTTRFICWIINLLKWAQF